MRIISVFFRYGILAVLTVLFPAGVLAQDLKQSNFVKIDSPWARASVGTMRPTAAYLTVTNTGSQIITITGVTSKIAGRSSIHETSVNAKGVSSMKPAEELSVEPSEVLEFTPGSYHIMLMDLNEPLIEGEVISLILNLGDGSEVSIDAPILSIGARSADDK